MAGEFGDEVTPALTFLVVGPSSAKDEFRDYLRNHKPAVFARLAGVEPLDKESDGQLLAFARSYYRHQDRMTPQRQ